MAAGAATVIAGPTAAAAVSAAPLKRASRREEESSSRCCCWGFEVACYARLDSGRSFFFGYSCASKNKRWCGTISGLSLRTFTAT
jgi:hypothetical protein